MGMSQKVSETYLEWRRRNLVKDPRRGSASFLKILLTLKCKFPYSTPFILQGPIVHLQGILFEPLVIHSQLAQSEMAYLNQRTGC
jgi:hypothetical protein